MDESSSGFGDESPILFKYTKNSYVVHSSTKNLSLDELYKELMSHLKKFKNIPREELKSFMEQVNRLKPEDPKNRWLVKKIRGLLNFILKKRADFQNCIVRGQIIIYEKRDFEQMSSVNTSSASKSKMNSYSELPSCMLTNNNFISIDTLNKQNIIENKNSKNSYDYSQDLFNSNTAEDLHGYAQENYQILKTLTQSPHSFQPVVKNVCSSDDNLFKIPTELTTKIEKVYQVHDKLEQSYSSFVSTSSFLQQNITENNCEDVSKDTASHVDEMMETNAINSELIIEENSESVNIFDDLTKNCKDLKDEFSRELEETRVWVSEIISNLMKLNIKKKSKERMMSCESKEDTSLLNTSNVSTSSDLNTYFNEENFKIIRDTCVQFKKKMEMKTNSQFHSFNLNTYDTLHK